MNWKRSSAVWLTGAYIGVLGIIGAQRERAWANDITYFETVTNTDFVVGGVGSLRDASSASLYISGIKGTVRKAYLYWHGPMNTDFPLANASIRVDGQTITGVHIGTSHDNCWGFANSQGYRADVTPQVLSKRNGAYVLSQFVKQGTNINANGASMLIFFEDGNTNNNRDIVLFEGNDSNAPNGFDSLGWNALLPGVNYVSGKAYLQMHVSDGQIYADDSVILNGAILQGRGSIFQGASVPSANNGPYGYGNLWDIKTWDITPYVTPGPNDFLLTHGYIQHDCISLVVAAFNLPAASAPPPPPPGGTNNAPTVTGQPEITVHSPAAIVVEAEARDNDGDPLDYTIAVGIEIFRSGEVPEGSPQTIGKLSLTNAFPLGDHRVVFTVSDGRTNASFTTIVHVIDNTAPVLHATNIVVPTDPGKTTAVVQYVVTATDDFPGVVTLLSLPPPGNEFPIGVTVVTVTAIDVSGNRSQTNFTITVTDALPPTITCPPDVVRFTDPGTNVAVVNYTVNFNDNQPGATLVCVPPSGSVFPIGATVVNCTARDAAGNTATCAFNVTINGVSPVNHPPALTGVTNFIFNAIAPVALHTVFTDIDGDALSFIIRIDDIVVRTGTLPPGGPITTGTLSVTNGVRLSPRVVTNAFALGPHAVTFEVNDGQAAATLTINVRIIDDTPPVIQVPPNIVVPIDPGTNNAIVTYTVTAEDDFPGPVQLVINHESGSAFPLGTTTVVVTATDGSSNSSTATFTVTVFDNVPPIIFCPPDLVRFTDPGTNVAVVTYEVIAEDNLPGHTVLCTPPSGTAFPVGTNVVNCIVTDAASNQAICTFKVTIQERPPNRPPTLTGQTELVINSNAPVVVTATATDLDGDALTYTIRIDGVVVQTGTVPGGTPITTGTLSVTNGFSLGTHTVMFEVTDGHASATFTTTVRSIDNTPPVINVPPNILVPVDPGTNNAVVIYTVTATDDFPGLVQLIVLPESGSSFPLGTTTVVVTATDAAGNTTNATFTVTVFDNVPPTIQCPTNLVRFADPDTNGTVVTYTVTASDNLPGAMVTCAPPSGSLFPLGTNLVTCTVTDAASNRASCTFTVIVNRNPNVNVPPTLTGVTELTINSNAPIVVTATTTDLDGDALTYTVRIDGVLVQTGTVPAGTPITTGTLSVTNSFGLGTHTVTFEVTDGRANVAFTTTVRVIDNTPPVINVPPNIIIPIDPGTNNAVVTYTVTATDNFPGPVQVVVQPESGSTFPIGTNTVVIIAVDSSGNTNTATFTVTVIDNVPPTILCPPNILRFADRGSNTALVTYVVNASDNLPGATLVCLPPSGSFFPLGTSAVNCTVTDAAGNHASCSFTVTVNSQPDTPTNRPPAVVGQAEIVVNHPNPIMVEALASDDDGNPLSYTIRVDSVVVQTGTIPAGSPQTIGSIGITNAFTLGNHTVVFLVNDGATNASFTTVVRVIDNTPPAIQVPANIVAPLDPGRTTATVTYTVTATDDFPGTITITSLPRSGGQFPLGTTTVVVTATDASGNSSTATFTITVVDNVPPGITCPPDILRFTDPASSVAIVHYTINATDNLPGVIITCTPPSGSAFPVGTTAVTCVARDAASNTASCVFNITIKDQPPIVTVPTNMIVAADLGQCSALVNYSVTVQDNIPGWTLVCTPASGSLFPSGTTTVRCVVTDAADNRASNSFTVTIEDREKPVLHLPTDITVTIATNQSSAVVNYVVNATDNCSAVTLVTMPPSGSSFPVGTTIVQCTATDASGNVAVGTFNVIVRRDNGGGDNEPPVIVSITPSKKCLWPPNHKMVTITFAVKATDNSGKPVTAEIISITSNEPENELGDGNTEHDFLITGALKAQLRAERSGLGTGRIYTIVIAVKDAAGNVTTAVTTVCVPHDQGQKDAMLAAATAQPKVVAPAKLVRVMPAKKK